jgi:hypothetical protein
LHLPPAPSSLITVAQPLLTLRRCLPLRHYRASSHAGCCVASTNAAASDLPASPPLIPPSPLVALWPPITLVRLVVGLPLLMPPPPIAGVSASHRAIASRCAMASRTSCPAGCRVASATHPLGAPLPLNEPLPLDAQHPPPTSRSPFAAASDLPASPPLILPSPLVAPWLHVPLDRLVVALPLLTPPPPICRRLRLSSRRRLSSRHGLPYVLSGWLSRRLHRSSSQRAPPSGCWARSSSSCKQVI